MTIFGNASTELIENKPEEVVQDELAESKLDTKTKKKEKKEK